MYQEAFDKQAAKNFETFSKLLELSDIEIFVQLLLPLSTIASTIGLIVLGLVGIGALAYYVYQNVCELFDYFSPQILRLPINIARDLVRSNLQLLLQDPVTMEAALEVVREFHRRQLIGTIC